MTAVYEALDAACGELRAAYGEDALCAVVSDHGSGGASQRVVHLNRRLAECGLLARPRPARASLDALARRARDLALRVLPPWLAEQAFRRARGAAARLESAARFGGFDWRRTHAFSEEANTQPGVWINLRGREAAGCVEPADYERVRGEVIDALLDWKLPGGGPVVARARRREEVYAGPCVARAPDVVVELALDAGYGLSLVATPWQTPDTGSLRTLEPHELGGGRGRGMNGTHRPDGIWLATRRGRAARSRRSRGRASRTSRRRCSPRSASPGTARSTGARSAARRAPTTPRRRRSSRSGCAGSATSNDAAAAALAGLPGLRRGAEPRAAARPRPRARAAPGARFRDRGGRRRQPRRQPRA